MQNFFVGGGASHEYLHEAEDSQFTDQPALSTVSSLIYLFTFT